MKELLVAVAVAAGSVGSTDPEAGKPIVFNLGEPCPDMPYLYTASQVRIEGNTVTIGEDRCEALRWMKTVRGKNAGMGFLAYLHQCTFDPKPDRVHLLFTQITGPGTATMSFDGLVVPAYLCKGEQ